jgi:DNA-directed RNA polymerase specialized sigma54-like protein
MSSLSPRLQVRVQQKQILTPGLVQMVSLLQLNRLELKEMISAEVAQNPVLEESQDGGEELSADELRPLLEAERVADPADQAILGESRAGIPIGAVDDTGRGGGKSYRSVRRNRFWQLLRRLSRPRL